MDVYIYLTHGNLVDIKTVCNGILICACIPLTWLLVYKNTMKETEFYINILNFFHQSSRRKDHLKDFKDFYT